jgi:uncharacterized PurR-regulated membrane protein YhhQ (DUF165 family)
MRANQRSAALFALYAACVPAANWMIDNVGTEAFPGGPHTIPVGFGYQAPSGVLVIGVALFLRDMLQRVAGRTVAVAAIAVGVVLSYLLTDPAIATASAVAFCVSELADFAVYSRLAARGRPSEYPEHLLRRWAHNGVQPPQPSILWLVAAVIVSGVIGGIIDSLLFLQIAFGSVAFWQGQVLAKTYMALVGGVLIWGSRHAVSDRQSPRETASVRGVA